MTNANKKTTLATVKAFVRNTVGKGLRVKANTRYSGMTDGIESIADSYRPVTSAQMSDSTTLGIDGAYFVSGSRNYFYVVNTADWFGFQVSNCVGMFELVIPTKK